MSIGTNLLEIINSLPKGVTLVAVSKTHPPESIMEAYNAGQRVFGENKVQELVSKYEVLPRDIEWHLIGHLQSNKVKYVVPFVRLIHSVDSLRLLVTIDREAQKVNRVVDCLLQIHIASEETKFGLSADELEQLLDAEEYNLLQHIRVVGLMGMATFTENKEQVRMEFRFLRQLFERIQEKYFVGKPWFCELSMGMSSDYRIAVEEGSTMVRIGSSIFGQRVYR